MQTGPKWSRIAKYVLIFLLASWSHLIRWSEAQPEPKPWYALGAISLRFAIPFALAILLFAADLYQEFRYQASSVVLKRFLDHLHTKYFPYQTGGLDPNFRVTLFTVGTVRRKSLGVHARSGGLHRTSRVRWSIKRSEAENYHGVAGYAWAVQIFVAIDGLPDYYHGHPHDKETYRQRTFATEEDLERLHWKARSYRGLVVKNQRGDKVGVLMMESKEPDRLASVTADGFFAEAEYLQFLLT